MKKQDHHTHAKQRLQERYGIEATDECLDYIIERIVLGHAKYVEQNRDGNNKVTIKVRKRMFVLIFNPISRQIATFLTPPVRTAQKQKKNPKALYSWKYAKSARNPHKQWA